MSIRRGKYRIVPLWPNEYGPRQNGWVFCITSPPMVARRSCTLKSRPRISVAVPKPSSSNAASGKRLHTGSSPSPRLYTASPQPESWSSDCRIIGFLASRSSCRSETGSAATQPRTRHMGARTGRSRLRSLSDRGVSMENPNRIWWARPRKLCAMERPGGGEAAWSPIRGGPAPSAHGLLDGLGPVGDHVGVHDRPVGVDRDREPGVGAAHLGDRRDRPAGSHARLDAAGGNPVNPIDLRE